MAHYFAIALGFLVFFLFAQGAVVAVVLRNLVDYGLIQFIIEYRIMFWLCGWLAMQPLFTISVYALLMVMGLNVHQRAAAAMIALPFAALVVTFQDKLARAAFDFLHQYMTTEPMETE